MKPRRSHNLYNSDCVSMGSMGSVEPIDFESLVPEPMDFEGGFHKIGRLFGFHLVMLLENFSSRNIQEISDK